jgi:apolipoprotein D and lipocalin family protein
MSTSRCLLGALALLAMGCQSPARVPQPTVSEVDLERFMGDWYVIATIPTPFERGAYNALEQYAMNDDGTIATTFSYNRDAFDGPRKTMHAKGFVRDHSSNAIWGMQFIWPIKADYRVIYLDAAYSTTIIGRDKRDYVWIMSRNRRMDDAVLDDHIAWLGGLGYDTAKLVRIPQQVTAEVSGN